MEIQQQMLVEIHKTQPPGKQLTQTPEGKFVY